MKKNTLPFIEALHSKVNRRIIMNAQRRRYDCWSRSKGARTPAYADKQGIGLTGR